MFQDNVEDFVIASDPEIQSLADRKNSDEVLSAANVYCSEEDDMDTTDFLPGIGIEISIRLLHLLEKGNPG